jgi:DNA transformation protein
MTGLLGLRNLGPTLCRKLAEVGIHDAEELACIGPARAYIRLVSAAGRRLPVCYYLYSLQGALRGEDWRWLSDREKGRLRREAGVVQRGRAAPHR